MHGDTGGSGGNSCTTSENAQEYLKEKKICAVFEGMVSQLLLCQPDDPAKSLIHHLCTTSGLQPPRSCPAPVPLKQAVPDKPEKADDKKQDTREEELKRINAEHKRKEEMKKLDEDSAADFASAF